MTTAMMTLILVTAGCGGGSSGCNQGSGGSRCGGNDGGSKFCLCGPMPQTCYNPHLGCYAGDRFMHRYPAFHGYYYRRPYNYRASFDYPWHAGLHEPTSLFSYAVEQAGNAQTLEATDAARDGSSLEEVAPMVLPGATRRSAGHEPSVTRRVASTARPARTISSNHSAAAPLRRARSVTTAASALRFAPRGVSRATAGAN